MATHTVGGGGGMVLSMYDILDPPLPVINIHSKSLRHSAAVKGLSNKIVKTALLELKGYTVLLKGF